LEEKVDSDYLYTYRQWVEINDAIGDAMDYAHDRAIEHPDVADPYWNIDEYVNRVLAAVFGSTDKTECDVVGSQGYIEPHAMGHTYWDFQLSCGHAFEWSSPEGPAFCPICGRRIREQG